MDLMAIANALVQHNKAGTLSELLDTLYAEDCVSVEAFAMPGGDGSREAVGLDAIKGKHEWWDNTMEMLGGEMEGPFPHGDDRFAVIFKSQAKNKETGDVMNMEEVAVYHVKDGKIVREEFFYTM